MDKRLEERLSEFEHIYNPQHFYCRLIELGIEKKCAKEYGKKYENEIYSLIISHFKKQFKN